MTSHVFLPYFKVFIIIIGNEKLESTGDSQKERNSGKWDSSKKNLRGDNGSCF